MHIYFKPVVKGVYSTWSPTIAEGVDYKILDCRSDVENEVDMPENFDAVDSLGQAEFTITIVNRKGFVDSVR